MKAKPFSKRLLALSLALLMLFAASCSSAITPTSPAQTEPQTAQAQTKEEAKTAEEKFVPDTEGYFAKTPVEGLGLNGWSLSEFTIVYSENEPDYNRRAALWLQSEILTKTGVELPVVTSEKQKTPSAHEIVVGETDREISVALNAKTEGLAFAYVARGGHIAMEGEQFVIAAAAYRFANDYLNGTKVPADITVAEPITAAPKHFVVMIGDGMGQNHVKLLSAYSGKSLGDYTDGENYFYGTLLPNSGLAITDNASGGTTDSAASATALSTGIKTSNGRIGRDAADADLLSITELAAGMGMSTAVMSTEVQTGATPSGFSAHATNRDETEAILASQAACQAKYGTIINANYNYYTAAELAGLEADITKNLATLAANEKGSFMMYEEAYIDKHSHNNKLLEATRAVARFNQAIGLVMEHAFYHPDTAVLITADHETGGLISRGQGKFNYSSTSHTNFKVPVFAYGEGMDVFDGKTIENVQIPKTLAKMMGGTLAAETDATYPPLL